MESDRGIISDAHLDAGEDELAADEATVFFVRLEACARALHTHGENISTCQRMDGARVARGKENPKPKTQNQKPKTKNHTPKTTHLQDEEEVDVWHRAAGGVLGVATQVEGGGILIGRNVHHSAFSLADILFSQSDEEEVGQH
jgi:hypothetical protein